MHPASHYHDATKCNNCGKVGHMYYQCKVPITSIGIIAVRVTPAGMYEYLMIRRKDTLGFIDFMRGKYSIFNRHYILNMLNQMTGDEKARMRTGDFGLLWQSIWGKPLPLQQQQQQQQQDSYRSEELTSRDKYNVLFQGVRGRGGPIAAAAAAAAAEEEGMTRPWSLDQPRRSTTTREINQLESVCYTLLDLLDESDRKVGEPWMEPEWGFPKGRRNAQEKDYDCALREFTEETGIPARFLQNVQNLMPYEEIFTGSNYKSYKHKYYVMFLEPTHYDISLDNFEKSEVSKMEWKTLEQASLSIRPYNLEKVRLLTHIDRTLHRFQILSTK